MAKKRGQITAYSYARMPDGSWCRTDLMPPEIWAAKRQEIAERISTLIPPIIERDAHLMQCIYEHPERFGAVILPPEEESNGMEQQPRHEQGTV